MSFSPPLNPNVHGRHYPADAPDRDAGDAASHAGSRDGPRAALPDAAERDETLRWLVATFERTQEDRVRVGEQIRAALQGRLAGLTVPPAGAAAPDEVLARIARGACRGPVPVVGDLYCRLRARERALLAAMTPLVMAHPAWAWIAEVRGVGVTLAGRLLVRLDVARAVHPSAFWAYCGLHTVAATPFACAECGAVVAVRGVVTPDADPLGRHRAPASSRRCGGTLRPAPDGGPAVRRAAKLAPRRGVRFDPRARALCHLVGVSILRRGTTYKAYYYAERALLAVTRPTWDDGRRHLTALRKTEKLFLRHLWQVWREAVGLPTGDPDPCASPALRDPWSMAG